MEIRKTAATPAFTAKFVNNESFQNVVKFAKENNMLRTLDGALRNLETANRATIRIIDGKTPNGTIYSTFMTKKRSVANNIAEASCPAEASLDGIIELGMLGKKFRSLLGCKEVKHYISTDEIIKKYTV